jgi:transposase
LARRRRSAGGRRRFATAERWPGSRGGDKRSSRIEAHADFLLGLVEDEGDPTLAEMQARLAERGTPVGIGTLHRFFARHGITRKKRRATRASRIVRTS